MDMHVVSKNIFWLTISRVLALVLLFLAYTQLFRYLGPEGSGRYQFILSYVLLFSTVVDFGVQQYITKKISEAPPEAEKYFHQFFSFEIAVASLLYIILVGIGYGRHYDTPILFGVAIAGLGMVANAMTYPFLAVMSAFQDLRKVALINFLNSVVNVTIIFLAIWLHKYIVFLASVQVIFGILDLILYRHFIKKHIPGLRVWQNFGGIDIKLIKTILRQAWPFVLLVGFSAVYNRIDVLIITKLKNYHDTGLYTAAYKMFDLLGFFPSVVSHTLFPFFAALMAKNAIGEIRINLEKYLKLMVAAALPIAVGGMLLSAPLIAIIAGPEYKDAAPVLSILIWAPAILFIYIPVNSLVISQLTRKALIVTGINVIVNIAGNLLLIPLYGIKAAAAMTVVSESIQGIFYFYFVRNSITKFSFGKFLWQPLVSAAAMGCAIWPLRDQFIIIPMVVGSIIYVVGLFITGFITNEEILTIKRLIGRGSTSV